MACRLCCLILIVALAGCASVPAHPPTTASSPGTPAVSSPPGANLATHSVQKGETLWRISRIYDIDVDEIATLNRISDATRLTVGQTIYLPGRARHKTDTATEAASRDSSEDFIWPAEGKVIAYFRETTGGVHNKGIDIATERGRPVVASRSGRVVFAGDLAGYGSTLILDHRDGLSSVYCGASELLVNVADEVSKGSAIARAGTNGRSSSGRLHFEIRRRHKPQNPLFYLD